MILGYLSIALIVYVVVQAMAEALQGERPHMTVEQLRRELESNRTGAHEKYIP